MNKSRAKRSRKWSARERAFMARALALARKHPRRVSPNPRVGAVVVKAGRVVGKGYHRGVGTRHAERAALARAGTRARGGELYLNLEPCVHHGNTPPCADAVIEAGIRRVVCSTRDPDPRVNGRGIRKLRSAGVAVDVGLMADEAEELNRAYMHSRRSGRPLVTLKLALTLDGRIADRAGSSRWITGLQARRLVHRLRREADLVVVGRETVARDNPRLTVRLVSGQSPARLVLDSRLRLEPAGFFFRPAPRVIVAATRRAPAERERRFERRGVEVWRLRQTRDGRVSIKDLLRRAHDEGMDHLLVEGGGEVASAFLREGLVNRIWFFYAPSLLGDGGSVPGLGDLGIRRLTGALRVRGPRWQGLGEDVVFTGVPGPRGRR